MKRKISPHLGFWSAFLGNLFEHYDAALFSFLSPFLAPLIFPDQNPLNALLLTYAIIPLGMLARPIGSLFFGYIGDMYGRGKALYLALGGMGIISAAIAVSPTYLQAGILAPVIFWLGRVLQNFFSSGETMGGVIFLLENSKEKRHDLLSSFYNASTIGGILIASAGVSLLSFCQNVEIGWRFLYILGSITALFGCLIRRKITDEKTPSRQGFLASMKTLTKTCILYRKKLFYLMIVSGFSYATYSMAMVLMNGFIPLISPLTKSQMIGLNTILLLIDFCSLPFFGYIASKVGRERLMFFSSLIAAISCFPICLLLENGTLISVLIARICLVLFGVAFAAPFHAWAQSLIPPAHRYSLISLGYALGSQIFGGPTAAISLWFFKKTSWTMSISWYWMTLACISALVIVFANKQTVTEKASSI